MSDFGTWIFLSNSSHETTHTHKHRHTAESNPWLPQAATRRTFDSVDEYGPSQRLLVLPQEWCMLHQVDLCESTTPFRRGIS